MTDLTGINNENELYTIHYIRLDHDIACRRICSATGTTVIDTWHSEILNLGEVPLLPQPFDSVVL